MAWPLDSPYESRNSGSTVVKADWADSSDLAVYTTKGGGRSLTRVTIDGRGDLTSGLAASGSLLVQSGNVIAGNHVLGAKIVGTASPGLEFRSGGSGSAIAATYAAKGQTSGGQSTLLFAVPCTSGQAITAVVNGGGVAQSGTIAHVVHMHYSVGVQTSGSTTPTGYTADILAFRAQPSGSVVGSITAVPAAGVLNIYATGLSGYIINWGARADIAIGGV